MRCVLGLALLLLASAGAAQAAPLARQELRVAVEPNEAPFSAIRDDGTWQGFNVDVASALCRRLRTSCTFVPGTVAEVVQQLQSRAVDMAPGLAITAARQRTLDFTAAYYVAPSRFIAPRARPIDVSPTGLAGKIVGVQRGSAQDGFAAATYPGIVLRRYGDKAELYLDLALGRLDAGLVSVIAGRAQFLDTPLGAEFDLMGPVLDDPAWFGEGVGIAVRKGDAQLLAALNQALRDIRTDGTFDVIRRNYFHFPIDGS